MTGVVYRAYAADGRLLYIGSTGNLARRITAHKAKARWREVARVEAEDHPTIEAARDAEARAICAEAPEWNKQIDLVRIRTTASEHVELLAAAARLPAFDADEAAAVARIAAVIDARRAEPEPAAS